MTRHGLTLVEIQFALAITTLVGAGGAAMLASSSQGIEQLTDTRRLTVKRSVVAERLGAAMRSSALVLGHDDAAVVLWAGDTRLNGLPNLSEIRRIQWDDTEEKLWFYAPPPDLGEAADTLYDANEDFLSITRNLMDTADFPARCWGTGVVAWSPTVDETGAGSTRVGYDLTIGANGATRTTSHTVALRSR